MIFQSIINQNLNAYFQNANIIIYECTLPRNKKNHMKKWALGGNVNLLTLKYHDGYEPDLFE